MTEPVRVPESSTIDRNTNTNEESEGLSLLTTLGGG